MPPWLIELLNQQNSKGFVDTLSTLAKVLPTFASLQTSDPRRMGNTNIDSIGNPVVSLNPQLQQKFARTGEGGYSGYKALDPKQKLGDYVLGHEYGHVLASGANNNFQLSEQLAALTSDGYKNEQLADDFQNVVQFLRHGPTDISKLNSRQSLIANILLQQPIYAQHPINQQRKLQQILQLIAPPTK